MSDKQIINKKAFDLGKSLTSTDRVLIQRNLGIPEVSVNKALSGYRKCIRGKSLKVIEMAEKFAEINKLKEELV